MTDGTKSWGEEVEKRAVGEEERGKSGNSEV